MITLQERKVSATNQCLIANLVIDNAFYFWTWSLNETEGHCPALTKKSSLATSLIASRACAVAIANYPAQRFTLRNSILVIRKCMPTDGPLA
jgi:hypothetical protein